GDRLARVEVLGGVGAEQSLGEAGLRVGVDDEDLESPSRQRAAEVVHGGSLADSTLLIQERDGTGHGAALPWLGAFRGTLRHASRRNAWRKGPAPDVRSAFGRGRAGVHFGQDRWSARRGNGPLLLSALPREAPGGRAPLGAGAPRGNGGCASRGN